jgi:hypothetical protein
MIMKQFETLLKMDSQNWMERNDWYLMFDTMCMFLFFNLGYKRPYVCIEFIDLENLVNEVGYKRQFFPLDKLEDMHLGQRPSKAQVSVLFWIYRMAM